MGRESGEIGSGDINAKSAEKKNGVTSDFYTGNDGLHTKIIAHRLENSPWENNDEQCGGNKYRHI